MSFYYCTHYDCQGKEQSGGSLQESMRYAIFASASYEKPANRRAYLDKMNKNGHIIDTQFSDNEMLVTRQKDTGELIIAFRGSTTAEDWLVSDLGILLDKLKSTPRYKRNLKTMLKILKKYNSTPKNKIVLTGHSLGGRLAKSFGVRFGLRAVVYNRGASPLEMFKFWKKKNKNVKEYNTKYDVVSAGGRFNKDEKETIKRKKGKFFHSIGNFVPQTEEEIQQTGYGLFTSGCDQCYFYCGKPEKKKKTILPNEPIRGSQIRALVESSPSFRGVFAHDQLPRKIKKLESGVINYNDHNESGSHWIAYYNHPDCEFAEFFDSYGVVPSDVIQKYLKTSGKKVMYNSTQIQNGLSFRCGYYCIDFIKNRDNNVTFYDILYKYKQEPKIENDKLINV